MACVGVVCELDSVFVFFDACFFVLSCFLVGIAWLACGCCLVVVGGWVFLDVFCSESLILAQDERWRRA